MSRHADAAQIHRWQEEVARDPGSPAFLPLAEVYRREGRLDVARRLCLRGLARHPDHVDAHVLLGRVYRELGDLDRAFDEWDIALRLDASQRAARRAIAYLCLERRDWKGAVRHLEVASAAEPGDERLRSALALARRHASGSGPVREVDAATALGRPLADFAREARVRAAILLEPNGRVLLKQGIEHGLDLAAIATLAAGVHVASRALAQMLGQRSFEQLYQGQGEHQLFLGPIGTSAGELILVAVFGDDTTIGMVRVRFDAFARELAGLPWVPVPSGAARSAQAFEAELASGLSQAQPS